METQYFKTYSPTLERDMEMSCDEAVIDQGKAAGILP